MKRIKNNKIIALMLVVLTLFLSANNLSYAVTEISNASLTVIQKSASQIQFYGGASIGWYDVTTNYIGYRENGKVYPAYCISHGDPRSR